MIRLTLRSALGGIVFAGLLAATGLPSASHASSALHRQTMFHRHPVVYVDPFSGTPDQYHADQDLHIQTHWEGVFNLGDPASTIIWTRRVNSAVESGRIVSPAAGFTGAIGLGRTVTHENAGPHAHARLSSSGCSQADGIQITNEQLINNQRQLGSWCVRFTGQGATSLVGFLWPNTGCTFNCPDIASTADSLSTLSSVGHGSLYCGGTNTQWSFQSNTAYADFASASNPENLCYHSSKSIASN